MKNTLVRFILMAASSAGAVRNNRNGRWRAASGKWADDNAQSAQAKILS